MQVSLTAFSPVDPVWRDLVLSRDGADFEFTSDIKRLRDSTGRRQMLPTRCRYNCLDPGRAPSIFEGFCKLKLQDPARHDLPTLCTSHHWPWYLCPHYVARVKGVQV